METNERHLVLTAVNDRWRAVERAHLLRGNALPLPQRAAWAERMGEHWLVVGGQGGGAPATPLVVEVRRPRALPGHKFLRVHRLVARTVDDTPLESLDALVALAQDDPLVLRVDVSLFGIESKHRVALEATLAARGFQPAREPESYERTALLDLRDDDATLLGRMTSMGRRSVRRLERAPVRVQAITERTELPAMVALVHETRNRTHGGWPARSLDGLVSLAAEHPDLLRIAGLYDPSRGRLLSFATGLFHGDHVSYGDGASTRATTTPVPLGYGPIWDLVRWARARGAATFDLGGIGRKHASHQGDPLAGISEFKRQFGGEERDVGSEWSLHVRPRRAAFAEGLSELSHKSMFGRARKGMTFR